MPALKNPKHERFAQEVAKGTSPSEAYVKAGFKFNTGNACRLKALESVRTRISECQAEILAEELQASKQAAERLAIDKEWVLAKLVENVRRALQERPVYRRGKPTGEYRYDGPTVNRALELIGKEIRMFIDRKEVGTPGEFAELENMTSDEPRAFRSRLGDDMANHEKLN